MIPKYRAWHKKEKRMYEVIGLHWDEGFEVSVDSGNYGKTFDASEIELLQYFPFKDKNKEEICEGDIVETEFGNSAQTVIQRRVVSFDDIYFLTHLMLEISRLSEKERTYQLVERIEIIGNIYENPKLSKREAK